MDFIFMLTRHDRTVADCLDVARTIAPLALRHVGFKDVGIDTATARALTERLKGAGARVYLELVSTSSEACRRSAEQAVQIGVDCVLGGTDATAIAAVLRGTGIDYLPFPGRPHDHPTRLGGSAAEIAADCRAYRALGCAGVDLLAYRAVDADPLALVRAARAALDGGRLVVAGSVQGRERIAAIRDAGADAFTVGSAVFDGSWAPRATTLEGQLRAVLDDCAAVGAAGSAAC